MHVAIDVVGWTVAGIAATAGALQTRYPGRVLDTARTAANTSRTLAVAGQAGVPRRNVSAVLVNLTVIAGTGSGRIVAWRAGTTLPAVTNDSYSATMRGQDWAAKVVDAVTTPAGLTVVGANDIEPGFASTWQQAHDWENAYLAATNAGLIFNGSADGCPFGFGHPGETCAYGWTEQQIYDPMYRGDGRVRALPQVYTAGVGAWWANIDATGGGKIDFVGALTEYQLCPAASSDCPSPSFQPGQGWAALYRAVATVIDTPKIPAVTDLRADS